MGLGFCFIISAAPLQPRFLSHPTIITQRTFRVQCDSLQYCREFAISWKHYIFVKISMIYVFLHSNFEIKNVNTVKRVFKITFDEKTFFNRYESCLFVRNLWFSPWNNENLIFSANMRKNMKIVNEYEKMWKSWKKIKKSKNEKKY